MSINQIQLSVKERLILSNQYRILETLGTDEAYNFRQLRIIVENGYAMHYDALTSMISEHGMSIEACKEVMDILDMYRSLKDGFNRLLDKKGISEEDVNFEGFDGNNESSQYYYARYLVFEERRWQEVLEGRPGFDLNSHHSIIEMYRRMLTAWNKAENRYHLSVEEARQILAERIHPDYRK